MLLEGEKKKNILERQNKGEVISKKRRGPKWHPHLEGQNAWGPEARRKGGEGRSKVREARKKRNKLA